MFYRPYRPESVMSTFSQDVLDRLFDSHAQNTAPPEGNLENPYKFNTNKILHYVKFNNIKIQEKQ